MSQGLTQQDRKQLGELADKRGNIHKQQITNRDCDRIRSRYVKGEQLADIASDYPITKGRVVEHLNGSCACENRAENITSKGHNPSNIHCPECDASYHYYDELTGHINTVHNA